MTMSLSDAVYESRRGRLEAYFDRTARDAWIQLTSEAPVSGVRATVRAGRDQMRETLLSWLPADMTGLSLLDAGCGTGALSIAAANRGARVLGVDVSGGLLEVARSRALSEAPGTAIDFEVGDMLDVAWGVFDHVVAMDSLIHYPADQMTRAATILTQKAQKSTSFTFAPRTAALSAMHAVGQLFPRGDKAPAIEPVAERALRQRLHTALPSGWGVRRDARIASGFYVSHALELAPA
jgi:magnesium-protoporphyrin O-methyltransferase